VLECDGQEEITLVVQRVCSTVGRLQEGHSSQRLLESWLEGQVFCSGQDKDGIAFPLRLLLGGDH